MFVNITEGGEVSSEKLSNSGRQTQIFPKFEFSHNGPKPVCLWLLLRVTLASQEEDKRLGLRLGRTRAPWATGEVRRADLAFQHTQRANAYSRARCDENFDCLSKTFKGDAGTCCLAVDAGQ